MYPMIVTEKIDENKKNQMSLKRICSTRANSVKQILLLLFLIFGEYIAILLFLLCFL